jgi:hypothetical protein
MVRNPLLVTDYWRYFGSHVGRRYSHNLMAKPNGIIKLDGYFQLLWLRLSTCFCCIRVLKPRWSLTPRADLPALFEGLHSALKRLADGGEVAPAAIYPPAPAVSIRRSITPDYLICLEDGKRFKSLRRHLATLGMTPEQYRAKWNLPSTYPMVAPIPRRNDQH